MLSHVSLKLAAVLLCSLALAGCDVSSPDTGLLPPDPAAEAAMPAGDGTRTMLKDVGRVFLFGRY